ncbi:R2-like ligand-binding oxidase [Rhodohalobacter sp. 8-1]|uniref:R2-like ligand-binding oxidase n=1 Tax=Rhodohalobacter sp. 8-1 TaxID=3131972 RepID=UPI0030EE1411
MWFKKDQKETDELTYFSKSWMEEWKKSINTSDNYKKKGKSWNAPIVLKIEPKAESIKEEDATGIFLNLSYGECLELRYSTEKDEQTCNLILKADSKTWINLIEKGKDPTMSILKNSVKLEKGSLIMLSTQRKAAEALLKTAPTQQDRHVTSAVTKQDQPKKEPSHTSFKTTTHGLNFESFPMKLFQKAKIYGIWNPADIGLSADQDEWKEFSADERKILIHLSALFMAGEEAVTLDLLPLIQIIAQEGRIEEEIYLTSFLWEEAKHTEFFSIYAQQVMSGPKDFESFHKPMYKILFYEKLPRALHALRDDSSALAQLKAAATYNMIVEGTLAETGYAAFSNMLKDNNLLPGLLEGIEKLKQDESRHIAFGIYLINRLLDDNPSLGEELEDLLEELLYDATNIIHEIFSQYDTVPFGLEKEWFLNHAIKQFQNRMAKLNL